MIGFCQTVVVGIGWLGAAVLLRRLVDLNSRGWLTGTMMLLLMGMAGRWLVAL